ncbi:MAG: hypothetical protein JRI80_00200 [Deltaproteobacteria bacterium]|nr:hypothetical protein [Deltaproteobacteria bacterium]
MATWELEVTPIDVERKEVSVTATRTDGADVRVFRIITALLDSEKNKQAIKDHIWAQYAKDVAKKEDCEGFIGDFAAAAKAELESKESKEA